MWSTLRAALLSLRSSDPSLSQAPLLGRPVTALAWFALLRGCQTLAYCLFLLVHCRLHCLAARRGAILLLVVASLRERQPQHQRVLIAALAIYVHNSELRASRKHVMFRLLPDLIHVNIGNIGIRVHIVHF